MLDSKGILFGIAMLIAGVAIGWAMSSDPQVAEAINVVGAEVITTDATTATFKVFKTQSETLETDTAAIDKKLQGQDKGNALKIAEQASFDLEFLNNLHQSLAVIQAENPCPSLEDWEAAGGVPGGNEPNPPEYPDCDPDVLYDPARCSLFWEDLDPQVDHPVLADNPNDTLTGRNTIITVFWNGTIYNIRLKDPSTNPASYPDNC